MKMFLKALAAGLAVAAAALPPSTSRADTLLGLAITPPGVTLSNELPGDQLVSVDTTTGAGMLVGSLDPALNAFGLATSGNRLFTFDAATDRVVQLDPGTAATLNSFGIGLAAGSVVGQGGLAFEGGNVGFLSYPLDSGLNPVNALDRFDIGTGTLTVLPATPEPLEALAFSTATGTLYGLSKVNSVTGLNDLYAINPTTGVSTLLGNTGVPAGAPTGGLSVGPGGMLFATIDDKLYTLSTANGAATPVGSSDPTMSIGFSSFAGLAAVPEPASVVMLGTGLAVACAAATRRGLRARPAA